MIRSMFGCPCALLGRAPSAIRMLQSGEWSQVLNGRHSVSRSALQFARWPASESHYCYYLARSCRNLIAPHSMPSPLGNRCFGQPAFSLHFKLYAIPRPRGGLGRCQAGPSAKDIVAGGWHVANRCRCVGNSLASMTSEAWVAFFRRGCAGIDGAMFVVQFQSSRRGC